MVSRQLTPRLNFRRSFIWQLRRRRCRRKSSRGEARRWDAISILSKMSMNSSPYNADWWDYIMEYSKDIHALLWSQRSASVPVIDDPKSIITKGEEPTSLKAAWELLEMFYAENPSHSWLPECLVDCNCCWSVGWLDIVVKMLRLHGSYRLDQLSNHEVKMLRLHGSYRLDQLSNRETENGLAEAVAVLISKMPRMRLDQEAGKLGECFKAKPDFVKAWEKWRGQINKLDSSAFWFQCAHQQTREGLRSMLQIMLGNANSLCSATCHWIELYISHLLYIRPFIVVVLAECLKGFGRWMVAHAMELLTAGASSTHLCSSPILTSINLASCSNLSYIMHGMVLLQILLSQQPVQDNRLLLKSIEICRLYELHSVTSNIMKIAGLLGSDSKTAGGLEFLHKYRHFKKSLQHVYDGKTTDDARQAVESLISLVKNPSTPERFYLPLLHDSVSERGTRIQISLDLSYPLLNVSQTNLLLTKLQELSTARLRPDFIESELPPPAVNAVRVALAMNLGRAILEE
ncbi:hypothetical protein V6N12_067290 [Hibiscus sabdariffa]|uniref:Nuclear pore complex protein Nup85 n=1 Tax=Hibiscus sabdariffa TaxID=183260 RepID=A0ABR2BDV8_9ROSI